MTLSLLSKTKQFISMSLIVVAFSLGGLMSIFLMGVYDEVHDKFCTVTKCGSGFNDETLNELNKELDMVKISKVMQLV